MKYIVALDQGTTSSRAVVFDETGMQVAAAAYEFQQIYPQPGWVEHDPRDILNSQTDALRTAVERARIEPKDILAIGITNQRETTLVWDKKTGEPLANAICWQCRRSAPLVERIKADRLGNFVRDITGLLPDAYFSGTKLQWLLQHVDGLRARAEKGEVMFGTVDTFLAYHLTEEHVHVTDATNAARTMLYNIHAQEWDERMLQALDIPRALLPRIVDSAQVIGTLQKDILGARIPIAALAGDQNAALFGQGCHKAGMLKNTYGTGGFMLMNTGSAPVHSQSNLLTTIAWRIDGKPTYALEGSVFVAGAVIQWLRDEMHLIENAAQSETIARGIPDNGGVYMVPAFTGLGAPHWDMYARGTIVGLTRGSGRSHIVRAALESIAFQMCDVLSAMTRDSGLLPQVIRVDGGASANNFLMQFQSDIANVPVLRPLVIETTALGAAMLAARAIGLWDDQALSKIWKAEYSFTPAMSGEKRTALLRQWQRAVGRAKSWCEEE